MRSLHCSRVISLSLAFFIGFSWTQVYAADASVVAVRGEAVAATAKGELRLKIGARVSDGDTVKTGDGGLLILAFSDGSRLKLKDSSQIVVHAAGTPESGPSGIDLVAGAVFALVTKHERQHFVVKTKTAVAGVRGTEFFTSVGEKDAFWLCVEEGAVDVTPTGAKVAMTVPKGLGVLVQKGKVPDPPKPYEWTKKLNWNMDPGQGDIVDHTAIDSEYQNLLKQKYD
jgi:ferric-dicitrate binding protein FerR (iron transport regulator)